MNLVWSISGYVASAGKTQVDIKETTFLIPVILAASRTF